MKIFVSCLVLIALSSRAYGLDCYTCSDTNGYDGESGFTGNCFATVASTGTSPTTSLTCATDSSGIVYYCRTMFILQDGVATGVTRGCIGSTSDEDANTAAVPGNNKCVTVLDSSGNPTDLTNCYYHCTTDNCNTISTSSLNSCATDCNIGSGGGSCNYIVGSCVCNDGFTGSDCSTTTSVTSTVQRACVQCNSLTDSGCASSTTSVDCPGSETYCSTTTTAIYDSSDSVVRTVVTRGCTTAFLAVDECSFTDIYSDTPINSSPTPGYNEFTCYSTCDTNGCNTNDADGVVNGNEAVVLQCVQCSDTTGDGSCDPFSSAGNTRSACPSGTTHCKSTVTYMVSNKVDLSNSEASPAYKLVSVVRECATAAVTSQCTTSSVGSLSFDKVTCTETCQEDGCNTGWPARPKCLTCSSTGQFEDGYDECLMNPPEATDCTYPYQQYCVLQESGIEAGSRKPVDGYPHRMVRGCSHFDIGTACSSTTPRSTDIETCNRTCTTDACNVGNGSSMPLQAMATVLASALIGWLAQRYF